MRQGGATRGHTVRIELLGTSFTIQSDEDPTYLREVVSYFSRKVDEVSRSVATADPLKISILAGILSANEFLKLRDDPGVTEAPRGADASQIAEITSRLIAALDEGLEDDSV